MSAPDLTFTVTGGGKVSAVAGHDSITVTFTPDGACAAFEARATKVGEAYGRGRGTLIASFSQTPAGASRAFEIYDEHLVSGDGEYRIGLYAQGEDGSWNDNEGFVPSGEAEALLDADGAEFLSMRE